MTNKISHCEGLRVVGGLLVQRTRIIGTKCDVFRVWERGATITGSHGSLTTFAGEWHGELVSRDLPAAIKAMRAGSKERIEACDKLRAELEAVAYAAIVAAFPEAANGVRALGTIEVWS